MVIKTGNLSREICNGASRSVPGALRIGMKGPLASQVRFMACGTFPELHAFSLGDVDSNLRQLSKEGFRLSITISTVGILPLQFLFLTESL